MLFIAVQYGSQAQKQESDIIDLIIYGTMYILRLILLNYKDLHWA